MADSDKFVIRQDIKNVFDTLDENVVYTSGIDNEHKQEVVPELQTTTAEKFIKGHSNSIIVLGKDRPAGISSGNGGKGKTGAASIDLAVGLGGPLPIQKVAGGTILSQKDFHKDAARIYISQMTDLDDYFKIPSVRVSFSRPPPPGVNKGDFLPMFNMPLDNPANTSGIGLKADHVRIIGRDTVKIVTSHYGTNSIGKSVAKDGVSLMAGYDAMHDNPELNLEPMVKGNKLVKFLEILINSIHNVHGALANFMEQQNAFNRSLLNHRHVCAAAGSPSDSMIASNTYTESLIKYQTESIPDNIYTLIKNELLKQYLHSASKDYILSKYHKLN